MSLFSEEAQITPAVKVARRKLAEDLSIAGINYVVKIDFKIE